MVSSGMLGRVVLVRTDVSEEFSASFIRVTRIGVKTSNLTNWIVRHLRKDNMNYKRKSRNIHTTPNCVQNSMYGN
jgi:hypothetical protein